MKFDIAPFTHKNNCLIYAQDDRAFRMVEHSEQQGSVSINEVEMILDESGQVIGLSGYCPTECWEQGELRFPISVPASVFCPEGLHPDGITISLSKQMRWRVLYDKKANTLCLCKDTPCNCSAFEIMDGLALSIDDGDLVAIWIRINFQA